MYDLGKDQQNPNANAARNIEDIPMDEFFVVEDHFFVRNKCCNL